MIRKFTKRDWWIVGGLTLAAALARFVALKHPGVIVFDETYFANFAHNYLTGTKFFDAEPPLGKFLIAGGEWLFGFNSFGWRFAPALLGTAVIPLMYLFVKRLFGNTVMATLAASLALLDGLLLVESRTAVLDGFVVFFNLLVYTLFLLSLQAGSRRRALGWLAATGVAFGLALSLKWIALAFLAPAVLILLIVKPSPDGGWFAKLRCKIFKVRRSAKLRELLGASQRNLQHPLTYFWFLAIIPAIIYILIFSIHVPFDSTGGNLWEIHRQIYNYHQTLQATHPYGSVWYTWPVLIRPVAYYFNATGGRWEAIVALGNPVIWWSGVLAVLFALVRFVKTRNALLLIVLFAILAHFAPWSLITRVLFIYHYLGALPFVIVALAYALSASWSWRPKETSAQVFGWGILLAAGTVMGSALMRSLLGTTNPGLAYALGGALVAAPIIYLMLARVGKLTWGQKQVIVFMGIAGLTFLYFLPVWTGIGLAPDDYYRHMWLRSWI